MSDIAIHVENLGKRYRIGRKQERYATLRDTLSDTLKGLIRRPKANESDEWIWALQDVSFDVRPGEVVGIIGRNGAGKSTLLKILSRITKPTTGSARIYGRVGSLLEVGTGFHPELTGRENVYLNGAIIGMKRAEIDRKFDEIVAFAEIEKFLDTPVKRYSSGMYVRLAFAVAAHLEPEILLVDEVLAVGDVAFQKKCLGKMGEVSRQGRTVLFVSHNMAAIQALCQRVLLLQEGRLTMSGPANDVITRYLADHTRDNTLLEIDLSDHLGRTHSRQKAITKTWLTNAQGHKTRMVQMGGALTIHFSFSSGLPVNNPGFGFGIEDEFGRRVFSLNNYMDSRINNTFVTIQKGTASLHIPAVPLLPGTYHVSISLVENQVEWVDYIEQAIPFQVEPADIYGSGKIPERSQGVIFIQGQILVTNGKANDHA